MYTSAVKQDTVKGLNAKIEAARAEIGKLEQTRKPELSLREYSEISNRINNLRTDIALCKRKLSNLRQGKKAHGLPEYDGYYGTIQRIPVSD